MSAEIVTDAAPQATKAVPSHPLAPLSASEITTAASIIKASWPAHTDLHFKVVTLQEPPKAEVLKYLEAEHTSKSRPAISRKAFLNYYIRNTVSKARRSTQRRSLTGTTEQVPRSNHRPHVKAC
jgi:primary-amine oxidase